MSMGHECPGGRWQWWLGAESSGVAGGREQWCGGGTLVLAAAMLRHTAGISALVTGSAD